MRIFASNLCKNLTFIIKIILISFLLHSTVNANNIEFELSRTDYTPGFFLLKIFPSPDSIPLSIQPVIVKNFAKNSKKYEAVTEIFYNYGFKILNKTEFEQISNQEKTNIQFVILGDEIENYLNFQLSKKATLDNLISTKNQYVENFINSELQEIYFRDFKFNFGGNVTDYRVDNTKFLSQKPITIIGKFKNERKTLLKISAHTLLGESNFYTPLPLQDTSLISLDSYALPELWDSFEKKSMLNGNFEFLRLWNTNFSQYFLQIILIILGLFLTMFGIRRVKLKNQITENWENNFYEQRKISTPNESSSTKTETETEIKTENNIDFTKNLPFEVINKFNTK